jgi:hypothetical protein
LLGIEVATGKLGAIGTSALCFLSAARSIRFAQVIEIVATMKAITAMVMQMSRFMSAPELRR